MSRTLELPEMHRWNAHALEAGRCLGPKSRRKTLDKPPFISRRIACSSRGPVKKMKARAADGKEMFVRHLSDKGRVHRIYKNSYNSIKKKTIQ